MIKDIDRKEPAFKVGDIVRMKTKEEIESFYYPRVMPCGWEMDMDDFCGTVCVIKAIKKWPTERDFEYYYFNVENDEDSWAFTPGCVDPSPLLELTSIKI